MEIRETQITPWGLLRWSFTVTRPVLLGFAAALLAVWACEILIPYILGKTVDMAVERRGMNALAMAGVAMVVVVIALYVAHVLYLRLEASVVADAAFRLRGLVYRRLIEQPLSFFAQRKSGELGHRIMNDADVLERHAIYIVSDVPFAIMTVLGVMAVMLSTHAGLAAVVLTVLLLASALSNVVGRPLGDLEKSVNSFYSRLGGRLQDVISGIRTVKVFGRERSEIERLDATGVTLADREKELGVHAAWLEPLIELVEVLGLVVVVWYGAYLLQSDAITAGQLVSFIAYMELLSEPVGHAGRHLRHYKQTMGTMGRIAEFLHELPPHPPRKGGSAPVTAIALRDVSFTYPGAKAPAVSGVTLDARQGEIVAIVGPNGAGKSTLMDLILGFQEPQAGEISAGGLALAGWDEEAWRAASCVMSQDVFLFHASLAENIRYGAPAAAAAEVASVVARTGLTPVIERMPGGLEGEVGDRGAKLSGGERQRVALARILLRNPAVLVFDEPTAAMDGAALRDINGAIRANAAGRITFVIAHRRETVEIADRVIVLDHGRVVAQGPWVQVEAQSELFRTLFRPGGQKR